MTEERAIPRITIVVTVHNLAHCVERCLKSLLKQSCTDCDIVVVDDGSVDGSGALCRNLLKDREGAELLIQPHQGVSAARQAGIDRTKTDYVMFLDGDDYLEPDTVGQILSALKQRDWDLVIFGFWYGVEHGRMYPVASGALRCDSREELEEAFPFLWDAGLMYSLCNKAFRVSLIRENRLLFEKRSFGEDFAFCRAYLQHCASCVVLDRCLYHYISHWEESLSARFRPDLYEIRVEEHRQMTDYFGSIRCDRRRAEEFLARRHIERVIGCFENEWDRRNPISCREKRDRIRAMVEDPVTIRSVERAELRSRKMRLLVLPVRKHWVGLCCVSGRIMAQCRAASPELFLWLKMHR